MRWARTVIRTGMGEKKDNFENLGADGRVWTGLIRLRTRTDGGLIRIR